MRILLINRNFGTLFGGGEAFDLAVAGCFIAGGHLVEILAGAPLFGKPTASYALNVNYLHLPDVRGVDLQLFQKWALRWILSGGRETQFDVIQCCGLFDLCENLLDRTRVGVVCWLPGEPPLRAQHTIRRLIKCDRFGLFSHVAGTHFLSHRMGLEEFNDFQSIPPGVHVPPQLPGPEVTTAFRMEHSVPEDATLGATLARLMPANNLPLLIQAVRRVNEKMPLWWLIAGNGPMEDKLRRQTAIAGMRGKIQFLGAQTRVEIQHLLAASDLFAVPSNAENHSLALLEAMAYRLPVVVPPVGDSRALVEQSGAGLIASGSDESSFAESLQRLCSDPALRKELGGKGHEFALTQTWGRTANLLLSLYRKTCPHVADVLYPVGPV